MTTSGRNHGGTERDSASQHFDGGISSDSLVPSSTMHMNQLSSAPHAPSLQTENTVLQQILS